MLYVLHFVRRPTDVVVRVHGVVEDELAAQVDAVVQLKDVVAVRDIVVLRRVDQDGFADVVHLVAVVPQEVQQQQPQTAVHALVGVRGLGKRRGTCRKATTIKNTE